MSGVARTIDRARSTAALRVLDGRGEHARYETSSRDARPRLRLVSEPPRDILVAGGDAQRRDTLVRELTERMPEGTSIREADATWQVLEHAPSSRLVMIAGEIEGSSPESVMHLLGSRHPQLPVVALGAAAVN